MSEATVKFMYTAGMILFFGSIVLTIILVEFNNWKKNRAPVKTARAVAYWKDPDIKQSIDGRSHTGFFCITFHTEDGEILNLYMGRDQYFNIPEGAAGVLTWQYTKFWNFKLDNGQEIR